MCAEPSPTREQAEARVMCDCGHAADWHSNHGKGDCEHDLDCLCEAFKEADPRQVENLIAEMRKRTRIVDDGWWCLARESELDSLAAAVSLLVTERDALRRALEAIARYAADEWREGDKPYQFSIVAREALAGGGRTPTGNVEWTFHSEPDLGVGAADVAEAGE